MTIVFIPIMVVANYSVQDVFSGNFFIWVGQTWFEKTLRSVEFWETLGRSAQYSSLVIAIEIPLGVFIALKIPKSGQVATLYIIIMAIPLLIPWFVVGLIWKIFTDPVIGPLGATMTALTSGYDLNSPLVAWLVILLVDVWHWTGLVVLLSYAGLVAIPEMMYQAAQIDGASRCHNAIANRGAHAVIPTRRNAKPWKPTTSGVEALAVIRLCGHRRSYIARLEYWCSDVFS